MNRLVAIESPSAAVAISVDVNYGGVPAGEFRVDAWVNGKQLLAKPGDSIDEQGNASS